MPSPGCESCKDTCATGSGKCGDDCKCGSNCNCCVKDSKAGSEKNKRLPIHDRKDGKRDITQDYMKTGVDPARFPRDFQAQKCNCKSGGQCNCAKDNCDCE